jgi:periplasmic divalent cation tolerance protein
MTVQLIYCTCPDTDTAERIATTLVERRLAACVNVLPAVTSIYRWQEAVERSSEVLLLIKTCAERYPALEAAIRELHPYELPEILAVEAAAGLPPYLAWVRDSTSVAG